MNQLAFAAELRDWVETTGEGGRVVFQGQVYNDVTHQHKDGEFITVYPDEIEWRGVDGWISVGRRLYALWGAYKKVVKKDLFDEN